MRSPPASTIDLPVLRRTWAIAVAGLLVLGPSVGRAAPAAPAESKPGTEPDPAPAPAAEAGGDEGAVPEEAESEATEEEAATSEEESPDEESEEDPLPPGVPERLPPLQQAGWWTVFGAFVLGTTAGVFAGLAERQEDKATRLASRFDLENQAQLLYEDQRTEYEKLLRRGEAFQNTAIGLGVASGAVIIAAATLFLIDRRRSRRGTAKRAQVRPHVGGFEVRF